MAQQSAPEGRGGPTTTSYVVNGSGVGAVAVDARRSGPICSLLGINDKKTRERLHNAIDAAIRERRPEIMLWRDPDHVLGCIIEVRPAREADRAVVTTSDLDEPVRTLRPSLLVSLLGLSQAEAEVAIALYDGAEMAEIADRRRVQLETVRGQVKNLLHKLNLPNQKRLGILLSRIALSPLLARAHPPHGGWQPSPWKI